MKKIIIAIDGYAATGKSTQAKKLAHHLGYTYIDTGALYRAVTLYAQQNNWISADGVINKDAFKEKMDAIHITFKTNDGKQETFLNGVCVEDEIRSMGVSKDVSLVAALPEVRLFLKNKQRDLGKEKEVIMDGRDIGTVIFPEAECKFFLTASPEIRAKRRFDEWVAKGEKVEEQTVLKNVLERDHIDATRTVAPLQAASDAMVVDVGNLTVDEVFHELLEAVQRCMGS